jgi:hypothetical protein
VSAKLKAKRGDTWRFVFAWQDASGVAIDLTGVSARMQLRTAADDEPASAEWSTTSSHLTIGTGEIELTVDPDESEAIDAGTYVSDLEVTWDDGTVTSTDTFRFEVQPDITRDDEEVTP